VDPSAITQAITFDNVEGTFANLGIGEIAASEKLAKEKNLKLGDSVPASFLQSGATTLVLSSIYSTEFPIQGPGWFISTSEFATVVPPAQQTYSAIYIALDDTSTDGVEAALPGLKAVTDAVPGAKLQNLTEYKKAQTDQVNQFLQVVYVLLALALVIAIVGVVNTLLLSVYERTRELGLLRAVGMSRRQVRSTIRLESVIISLMGTLIGLLIGIVFGWALVTALVDEGITSFSIPWSQLIIIVIIAILAGVGAALYPARRAARLDVLRAISSD